MRKIPTLFRRDPEDMRRLLPEVTPGCEWVLAGEGEPTRKYDGTCVLLLRDGAVVHPYVRREVKRGKTPPPNFRPVETDPVTGKTVGWEPAEQSGFAKYVTEALAADDGWVPGTYELVGPKINGNPEARESHVLIPHEYAERIVGWVGGDALAAVHADIDGDPARLLDAYRDVTMSVAEYGWEGIVWHHPDGRMAKIKARDFR